MSQIRNLSDNQKQAIDKLQSLKVGALFMKPGTGKTWAACELIKSTPLKNVLWLTPFRNKRNIENEIYLPGYNVLIVGIETISMSDRVYLELLSRLNMEPYFIIVDESLKIKNWNAKRTKRIIELGKLCEYKLVLNGTPLTKNIIDLWAQMEFLSPKILKMGLAEFENTFCEWVKITKKIEGKYFEQKYYKGFHNIEYLYSIIRPYVYECDLSLAVKQNYFELNYQISVDTISEYNRIKEKYLDDETLRFMNNNIFIEMTQKMQHLYCCDQNKFSLLDKIISQYGINNILIFCKFVSSRQAVESKYPQANVLSYGMHSLGLNLQKYNVVVYFDKTFDYAQRIQSEHRIFRTGQTEDCIYYDLTGNVGLETLIDKNIIKKANLLDYFKQAGVKQIKTEL